MGTVDSDSSDAVVELKGSGAAVVPTTPSSRAGPKSVVTSRSAVLGCGKVTPGKSVLSSCRWYSWLFLASLYRRQYQARASIIMLAMRGVFSGQILTSSMVAPRFLYNTHSFPGRWSS